MQRQETFPFVVGCPRSGTTLLRAMLDSHPDLAVPQESFFVPELASIPASRFAPDDFLARLTAHDRFGRWELPVDSVAMAVRATTNGPDAVRALYRTYAHHRGKLHYGDKTPQYVRHIDQLASLFPEARFLHLVRDGRDVGQSLMDGPFGPSAIAVAARVWRTHVMSGRHAGRALPEDRYHELRYEDLVATPEKALRDVCAFFHLTFAPQMLDYAERADDVLAGSVHPEAQAGVRRSPTAGLRDWRATMAPRDVGVFEAVAGDALTAFGYGLAFAAPTPLYRLEAGRQVTLLRARKFRGGFVRVFRRATRHSCKGAPERPPGSG